MRNSTSGSTPKTKTVQDESISNNAEKTSAKKLKQARLPFKIIAPGISPASTKTAATPTAVDKNKDTNSTDGRKRKLSYNDTNDGDNNVAKDGDDNVSKENVEILAAATKKKKLCAGSNNEATSEVVVSLLDDDDTYVKGDDNNDVANVSINCLDKNHSTLKSSKVNVKDKRKGAGSPQTSNAQKDKTGSASKLQIKLPLSAGKKKRRKSKLLQLSHNSATENSCNYSTHEFSSDDIEEIAVKLNPQKRKKLIGENDDTKKDRTNCAATAGDQDQGNKTIVIHSEPEKEKHTETKPPEEKDKIQTKGFNNSFEQLNKSKNAAKNVGKDKETSTKPVNNVLKKSLEENDGCINISDSSDENEKEQVDKEDDLEDSILTDNDNEADDETDNLAGQSFNISSDISEHFESNLNNTIELHKDAKNVSSSSKNPTSKQLKLMEQRRKAREEKERKLQEEKTKKQREKEEKELAKKREREEKEEQKRKERGEKEEQRRKEREEKERKRLAEIEAKNEEKRKKNEAKEEELRKKEDERKRKEQEKEEAELKKRKAAQAFTKFFFAKTPTNVQVKNDEDSNTGDGTRLLAFRPFQIKGDMQLAPLCRKNFTPDDKNRLDELLGYKANEEDEMVIRKYLPKSQLYLSELRSGKVYPGKWRRPSTESKDDVILLEDELDRVGQAIVEDTPAYIREEMRVKFYKFHDNRRPPYYGTWRKKSTVVKPRKPFEQDKQFFDYEVDSDDEWEEEEPGESLEDGSDEDKEKESEDDDYEVDNEWFVPHGHLSDEELQNEDEFGMGDDNTREAQKAKLQLLQQEFAQEMKKKTEKIKPRLIGCIWADTNGNQPLECAKVLWDTLEKKAMLYSEPPLIEEPEVDRSAEPNSPSGTINGYTEKTTTDKLKPISLSGTMVKDLTRLIHGNNHAKNFLINEYIAYVEKTEEAVKNGDLRKPLKSVIRDKIDELAEWQAVDATASSMQDMEHTTDDTADKKKKKVKRRLCWVVKQEMLDKMDLSSLKLRNSWKYTLPPKFVKADKEVKPDESAGTTTSESNTNAAVEGSIRGKAAFATSQITKFTKCLKAEEVVSKLQNTPASNNASSSDKSSTDAPNASSKEKKRVPLLMSVARGQQFSTPAKNKLISKFLQQKSKDKDSVSSSPTTSVSRSKTTSSPVVEDDDVMILD